MPLSVPSAATRGGRRYTTWMHDIFVQDAPRPAHGYRSDWLVRSYLQRNLPADALRSLEPLLLELGELAVTRLWDLQLADRANVPTLTHWDAWGKRIDHIEATALWREAAQLTTRFGLTALPYEQQFGPWARTCQFSLVHLFHPVTDVYSCPLAMTDGAARTLIAANNSSLVERAVPRLTSRDPATFWTSGQWMTESTGGSDVGESQTVAEQRADGAWLLRGKKWFTSATTSQMALTLARPLGNSAGGRGLALFYLETRDPGGQLNGIRIERLKDKLGTRKVPTAELTLDGAVAHLVAGDSYGTRAIEPMLRITRTWNSVCAASFLRHGLGLAYDYANKRRAFGAQLIEHPLHRETLATVDAESAAAFVLTFYLVELLGHDEHGLLDERRGALLRMLLPIVKATTGKQAAAGASELVELFGGAGYVEDTGIPVLLRDAQVLPIWEGTTNVLALDMLLRAEFAAGFAALREVATACCTGASDPTLDRCADLVGTTLERVRQWHEQTADPTMRQRDARRVALTLGRTLALALLVEHARELAGTQHARAASATAVQFAEQGVDGMRRS